MATNIGFPFRIGLILACLTVSAAVGGEQGVAPVQPGVSRGGVSLQGLRGTQPIPGAVAVGGTVVVEGGRPRPVFAFTMIDAAGKQFTPDATRLPAASVGTFEPAPARGAVRIDVNPSAFTIQLPPGEYKPAISGLPNGYTIKSVVAGGTDLLKQPLKVEKGGPPSITITLLPAEGKPGVSVRGRVVNATTRAGSNGQPSPAASVVLSSPSTPAFSEPFTAALDATGAFDFPWVLPGSYTVYVLPGATRTAAASIVVGEQGIANLDVVAPAVAPCGGC
jgi:hypothetical protein